VDLALRRPQAGGLLVTLALGYVTALEAGVPIDAAAARRAVLALLSAPERS
jgi:hypothetical protein